MDRIVLTDWLSREEAMRKLNPIVDIVAPPPGDPDGGRTPLTGGGPGRAVASDLPHRRVQSGCQERGTAFVHVPAEEPELAHCTGHSRCEVGLAVAGVTELCRKSSDGVE
jgi:hypothetical protein